MNCEFQPMNHEQKTKPEEKENCLSFNAHAFYEIIVSTLHVCLYVFIWKIYASFSVELCYCFETQEMGAFDS